jgi:hypothetical protein
MRNLLAPIFFMLSSGIFFSFEKRKHRPAYIAAGLIAIASAYFTIEQFLDRVFAHMDGTHKAWLELFALAVTAVGSTLVAVSSRSPATPPARSIAPRRKRTLSKNESDTLTDMRLQWYAMRFLSWFFGFGALFLAACMSYGIPYGIKPIDYSHLFGGALVALFMIGLVPLTRLAARYAHARCEAILYETDQGENRLAA